MSVCWVLVARRQGRDDLGPESTPLDVPGYGALESTFQILPIEDVQIETYKDKGLKPADRQNTVEVLAETSEDEGKKDGEAE